MEIIFSLNDRLTGTSANPNSAPNILREKVYSIDRVKKKKKKTAYTK